MTAAMGATCPECHGAGEWKTQVAVDNWDMGQCEACGGTGYVPVVIAPTPDFTGLADPSALVDWLQTARWLDATGRIELPGEHRSSLVAALRHAADLEREADELRGRLAEAIGSENSPNGHHRGCRVWPTNRWEMCNCLLGRERARLAAVDQPGAET